MTAPPGTQVTPAELRALDARYRPFPDFQAFSAAVELDTDLWERVADGLQQKQADASADFDRAVEVALRAAAVDTGALEGEYTVDRGFTMTVATQEQGWEKQIAARGERVRRLFEAQLRGYELAQELASSDVPITEAWIRQLHTELAEGAETYWVLTPQGWREQALPKGTYKQLPNHVLQQDGTRHAYAPVDRVPDEMRRLVAELRTPVFDQAHPVLQAAYAHYALVVAHPFADLNGRAARALASTFLLRAQQIPLVIFADQRNEYLDALGAADQGNCRSFVDFIFHCAIQATQLISSHLVPPIGQQAEKLEETLALLTELSEQELWIIGGGLLGSLEHKARSILSEVVLPDGVDAEVGWSILNSATGANIDGYRAVASEQSMRGRRSTLDIDLRCATPFSRHTSTVALQVLASMGEPASYPLLIRSRMYHHPRRVALFGWREAGGEFPVRLADVHPIETAGLKRRLDAWLRGLVSDAIGTLNEVVEQSLREAGL
ncbi:MAG: Fic family protein [Chloroflexota bacterium]|nr:Fic family protein [Chloroflexota bacterium]